MNGIQIATWIILAATIALQAHTFWRMRRTAKIIKDDCCRQRGNATYARGSGSQN